MALILKKLIIKLTYFGAELGMECDLPLASAGIDHALVVLTIYNWILPPVYGSSLWKQVEKSHSISNAAPQKKALTLIYTFVMMTSPSDVTFVDFRYHVVQKEIHVLNVEEPIQIRPVLATFFINYSRSAHYVLPNMREILQMYLVRHMET